MNPNIFPYAYANTDKPLSIEGKMTKGVWSGPASIIINGKKVCSTNIQDQIEIIG
jgi:hypothetical protein